MAFTHPSGHHINVVTTLAVAQVTARAEGERIASSKSEVCRDLDPEPPPIHVPQLADSNITSTNEKIFKKANFLNLEKIF